MCSNPQLFKPPASELACVEQALTVSILGLSQWVTTRTIIAIGKVNIPVNIPTNFWSRGGLHVLRQSGFCWKQWLFSIDRECCHSSSFPIDAFVLPLEFSGSLVRVRSLLEILGSQVSRIASFPHAVTCKPDYHNISTFARYSLISSTSCSVSERFWWMGAERFWRVGAERSLLDQPGFEPEAR